MPWKRIRRTRRRFPRRGAIVLATVVALLLGIGGYVAFERTKPLLLGDGCVVRVAGQVLQLDPGQAGVAATVAGVGHRMGVPRRAVTIAFATALQESHLRNVAYGDRDSVGIFQQRPSQGWGTRRQLRDPVYASSMFFAALVKVPRYLTVPVDRAAQAVQHSADGTAYRQYEQAATLLSAAFTGDASRAAYCWYEPYKKQHRARLAAAESELTRTFGPLARRASAGRTVGTVYATSAHTRSTTEEAAVAAEGRQSRSQTGWAIATWAVTHAKTYGIREVRYAGYVWNASNGQRGWRRDRGTPADTVQLS